MIYELNDTLYEPVLHELVFRLAILHELVFNLSVVHELVSDSDWTHETVNITKNLIEYC